MKIRLSLSAASDLDRIIEYLEERNPLAASETVEAIFEAIDLLLKFPEMGRLAEEPGIRELVIESTFVVPYSVQLRDSICGRSHLGGAALRGLS